MKKIFSLILFIICLFLFTLNVFASTNLEVNSNDINIKKGSTVITGKFPVVNNMPNLIFQKSVNKKIDDIIKTKTTSYSQKVSNKVEISYDVIQDKNILSIVIYFKNLYTNDITPYSVNIDTKKNKFISINSYLGANGLNYTNKVVSNKANNMGITYKKVNGSTPFYIKNNNVYVVFGAGSLTFSQKGNIIFEIPYKNIKSYKVDKNLYYKKSQYNVKMVPLREPLKYFGYTMNWKESSNSITILKDEKFVSYLVIGENKYSDKNNKVIRQLEFPPEIKNGIAYVPISYFSQILEMLFAVDDNENIIISSYIL